MAICSIRGDKGGAGGYNKLRQGGDAYLDGQHIAEGPHYRAVEGHSANQGHPRLYPYLPRESGSPERHGSTQPRRNSGPIYTRGQQPHYLRLCEHRTCSPNRHRSDCLKGQSLQSVHRRFKRARHHFKKTSGSGGTAVVQREIQRVAPRIHSDRLAVLTADINDGARFGFVEVRPARCAGYLGHSGIGHGDRLTPVPGRYDHGDSVTINIGSLKHLLKYALTRLRRPCAAGYAG